MAGHMAGHAACHVAGHMAGHVAGPVASSLLVFLRPVGVVVFIELSTIV